MGDPQLEIEVQGTCAISEIMIIRDGASLHTFTPHAAHMKVSYVDRSFGGNYYYYLRIVQADKDEHGDRSRAWSSPIWVTSGASGHFRRSGTEGQWN